MKKTLIFVLIMAISLTMISTAFAATLEDPVFDYVYATLNSQGVVTFTIYTSYTVPSITITSCTLQKKNNNVWEPVTSDFTLINTYFDGDSFHAQVDYSSNINSGQYRVKFKPKADNHTITCYSTSHTY